MALEIGRKLGPYEMISLLSAGGMGEVYLARDTKLDRDVAIKVLPESLAHDKERVLRFEREAKLLASLNHSNIAQIYGFEESGDQKFLVLEYVEGESLSARLKRSRVPVDEALEIGRQIAEALEAAHEKVIIHRDLKPGNVMIAHFVHLFHLRQPLSIRSFYSLTFCKAGGVACGLGRGLRTGS